MQILLDNRPIAALSPKQKKQLDLGRARDVVSATVISEQAANNRVIKKSKLFNTFLGVFCLLLIGSILTGVLLTEDNTLSKPFFTMFGLSILFAIFVMLRWNHDRTLRLWRAKAADRSALIPSVGTNVRTDRTGLWLGPTQMLWRTLRIESLRLFHVSQGAESHGPPVIMIERLVLECENRLFALDINRLEGDLAIVSQIYRVLEVDRYS